MLIKNWFCSILCALHTRKTN